MAVHSRPVVMDLNRGAQQRRQFVPQLKHVLSALFALQARSYAERRGERERERESRVKRGIICPANSSLCAVRGLKSMTILLRGERVRV